MFRAILFYVFFFFLPPKPVQFAAEALTDEVKTYRAIAEQDPTFDLIHRSSESALDCELHSADCIVHLDHDGAAPQTLSTDGTLES